MIDPSGEIVGLMLYADCRHRWWTRLWDRVRGRGHPPTHLVYHSPMFDAFREDVLRDDGLDLDADTVRVSFTAEGYFTVDEGRPPIASDD